MLLTLSLTLVPWGLVLLNLSWYINFQTFRWKHEFEENFIEQIDKLQNSFKVLYQVYTTFYPSIIFYTSKYFWWRGIS